jgi:hypothetical protein
MRRFLVIAEVVPVSPIIFTLMMEALSSFENSVLAKATSQKTAFFNSRHDRDVLYNGEGN